MDIHTHLCLVSPFKGVTFLKNILIYCYCRGYGRSDLVKVYFFFFRKFRISLNGMSKCSRDGGVIDVSSQNMVRPVKLIEKKKH